MRNFTPNLIEDIAIFLVVFCSVGPIIDTNLLWTVILSTIVSALIVILLLGNLKRKWRTLLISYFFVFLIGIGLEVFITGLFVLITVVGYGIIRKKKATTYLAKIFYYFFDYVVFLFIIGVIIALLLKYIEKIPYRPILYVRLVIWSVVLFITVYVLRILNTTLDLVLYHVNHLKKEIKRILTFTAILLTLCLPDLAFAYSVYDLYLNTSEMHYSFFQRYYYVFSQHFLLPVSGQGIKIQKSLDTLDGKLITISHTLLIRTLDLTIVATMSSMFSKLKQRR